MSSSRKVPVLSLPSHPLQFCKQQQPDICTEKTHSPQHLLTHFVVECCKCFNCQFRHCLLSEFLSALRSCWYGSAHSSDNEVIPLGLLKHCLNLAPLSLFVESSSPHFADADENWSWKLLNAFDLRAGVWEMQEWMQFPIANWSISDESLQELNFSLARISETQRDDDDSFESIRFGVSIWDS